MLVLKLKKADRVTIGDIVLDIKDAGAGRVRIAFGAPKGVKITNHPGGDTCPDPTDEESEVILEGPI